MGSWFKQSVSYLHLIQLIGQAILIQGSCYISGKEQLKLERSQQNIGRRKYDTPGRSSTWGHGIRETHVEEKGPRYVYRRRTVYDEPTEESRQANIGKKRSDQGYLASRRESKPSYSSKGTAHEGNITIKYRTGTITLPPGCSATQTRDGLLITQSNGASFIYKPQ